jgi:phosphate transport system permease protein
MSAAAYLPDEAKFKEQIRIRQGRAARWQYFFLSAILIGLLMLVILLFSILNEVVGLVAVREAVNPAALANGRALDTLTAPELADVLKNNLSKGKMQALFIETVTGTTVDRKQLGTEPIKNLIPDKTISDAAGELTFAKLTPDDLAKLLGDNVGSEQLLSLIGREIVKLEVVDSWSFLESAFNRAKVEQEVAQYAQGIGLSPTLSQADREKRMQAYAESRLEWRSWLNPKFLVTPMSTVPSDTGVRGAIVGTLWVILLTMAIAVPLGVGAALYLEEYASRSLFNRIIETNIRNLAGVPSIIYGLLGLAIFVNALNALTTGKAFGIDGPSGGTILSASLTLALLILPVIIINSQEAIRAVPSSLREASYGLGATKWQTIRRMVLPSALPGIMTGIILSLSRAVGETAPLVVVGAAVFLSRDPNGPFNSFTTLPIQIYDWIRQPSAQFRDAAAAGIVMLLVILLALNATAILIRQRFSRSLQ